MKRLLKANLWKFFLLVLTNRRNYLPILSIYFLTLPNTTIQQIGLFLGIGWFAAFFLEVPSGYFSDKFGHKKTLILAKFSMLASTLFFVFGDSLSYFIMGSILVSFGFAFTSGTSEAFFHNTLVALKREKDYGEVLGKIHANASLVSAVMILTLPLLTNISLIMPIKVFLIFDLIGILTAFSLYSPKIKYTTEDEEGEKIWQQLKRFKGTGFYTTSLFLGVLGGFMMALFPFKEPFLTSLGFPVIFIGSVMALSRVVWFIVGHNLKYFKKIEFRKLLFYEIFFFSGFIILISQLNNPYIIGFIIAVLSGYRAGRNPLISEYYLNNFLINRRYKATMFSIKQQISRLFDSGIVFAIGFVMTISFHLGFLVIGICMIIALLGIYPFLKKCLK